MNFLTKFISLEESHHRAFVQTCVHIAQKADEYTIRQMFDTIDFSGITSANQVEVVRFITRITHSYEMRGFKLPEWAFDERLQLERPYIGKGYNLRWFFFAPRAMFRHNCFFDPASLEVM